VYQFKEPLNREQFFWWEKKLIENKNWALLPKPAKAIFPVIAAHADEQGRAFPGERTIAILSGRTDKMVREGIRQLQDFPPVQVNPYVTKNGRRAKRFHVKLPKQPDRGTAFPFHRMIIEGGNWSLLKPTARALYPVMRYFGFFDIDLYMDIDDPNGDVEAMDFEEVYKGRDCDYCEAEKGIMLDLSGISRRSMAEALQDLENHHLIQPIPPNEMGISGWKVFLHAPMYYKRAYLNQRSREAYGHET
jgi:hypothetical protein